MSSRASLDLSALAIVVVPWLVGYVIEKGAYCDVRLDYRGRRWPGISGGPVRVVDKKWSIIKDG